MMVDYKPTHDPNQDTFKVEYLLGGAAVLGFILPGNFKYIPTEVRLDGSLACTILPTSQCNHNVSTC
jgi:hypothetical protein